MTERGHRGFCGELTRFAEKLADPRVTTVAERLAAPLRIAVRGRRGVGRRTVAHALACAGLTIANGNDDADIVVYVTAEAAKPEDTDAVTALPQPVVVVLNKVDITGHADIGEVSERIGAPVVAMSGLFAVAALVDGMDELRRSSGIDTVTERIDELGAHVRYRRLLDAVTHLEVFAVADRRIGEFLAGNDTVIARMAAAVGSADADGLAVESGDDPAAYLRRAVHWQRYSRGPLSDLHRTRATDIARGSLRLWSLAGESP